MYNVLDIITLLRSNTQAMQPHTITYMHNTTFAKDNVCQKKIYVKFKVCQTADSPEETVSVHAAVFLSNKSLLIINTFIVIWLKQPAGSIWIVSC